MFFFSAAADAWLRLLELTPGVLSMSPLRNDWWRRFPVTLLRSFIFSFIPVLSCPCAPISACWPSCLCARGLYYLGAPTPFLNLLAVSR